MAKATGLVLGFRQQGVALILFKTLVIICGLQLLRYANVLEEKEQEQNRRGRDYLKHFGTVEATKTLIYLHVIS